MKNQENSLKNMAKLAKQRLKHQDNSLKCSIHQTLNTEEEKALTDKILCILKTNFDTPTPLRDLIDHKKFEALSSLEKEIYIFELIDKYNYYRDWYDNLKKEESLIKVC